LTPKWILPNLGNLTISDNPFIGIVFLLFLS